MRCRILSQNTIHACGLLPGTTAMERGTSPPTRHRASRGPRTRSRERLKQSGRERRNPCARRATDEECPGSVPGLDIQRIPEGAYRIGCWVGTNENVRLKLLDAVGLKQSGRVAVFNSLQPDITAVGRDRLPAEQQKKPESREGPPAFCRQTGTGILNRVPSERYVYSLRTSVSCTAASLV